MFPDQLEQAFKEYPLVYLPYGICEPHGPHNAVGLDGLKAHAVCRRAAETSGGIVAPPDYWHIHEIGGYACWASARIGDVRPWLTAVPPWIHFKNVCYQIRAVDALGFHAAILLTGHYGPNWEDLKTLVSIIQPHFATRLLSLPDFEANTCGFKGQETGDHAGRVETSLLWALEPSCVDVSRLPSEDCKGLHFGMGSSAFQAHRRIGEEMVEAQIAYLGLKGTQLLRDYDSNPPSQRQPMSFEKLEELWHIAIEPSLKSFRSMQQSMDGFANEPAVGSQWRINWEVPKIFG